MIDGELLTRKAALIVADLDALERLGALSEAEYLGEAANEVLAERYLERIVGRMVDINFHLVTESGRPPPKDYFDSFLELGRLGVLDPDLARRIAPCTGLRNRIAHEYDEIDERLVLEGLRSALRDVPRYLAAVQAWSGSRATG